MNTQEALRELHDMLVLVADSLMPEDCNKIESEDREEKSDADQHSH